MSAPTARDARPGRTFPRRQAVTRRFSLGAPRRFTVSPDGARVVFLRSRADDDPTTCLWTLDVATGDETLRVDPAALAGDAEGEEDLPPEERARRERVREQSGGVVEYATDAAVRVATVVLGGRAHLVTLDTGTTDSGAGSVPVLPVEGPVVDPRPDPSGTRVAFVRGGALHVHEIGTSTTATVVGPEPGETTVTWGLAEFVAAEEMNRYRGYWWAPDGSRLLAARVDEAPVARWHVADPAHPERTPNVLAYPAAGTANARVSLAVVDLDGTRVPVELPDDTTAEYVADVRWDVHDLLVTVSSRDQRAVTLLSVDPDTGRATPVHTETDPAWVDLVPGVPAHLSDGTLVRCADADDTRRLVVGDAPVTPPGLQVRGVLDVDRGGDGAAGTGDVVVFTASQEPTTTRVWTWSRADGPVCLTPDAGAASARRAGGTTVLTTAGLDRHGATTEVLGADGRRRPVASFAETPDLDPAPHLLRVGERELATAVLLPSGHDPAVALPVLLDPYGGPHAQRVVSTQAAFTTGQWFAEQGFAVVVVDGRGTPGRGPAFERAVRGDLAGPVLDDQLDALAAVAARLRDEGVAELDLGRVGIRGWSFGGYLAALAVLRRPDVVHAAVAGAPVTDWSLYDTHYTERYLGTPDDDPDAYARSSIVADAERPASVEHPARPLLVVHGLADDNVVAAHTLRLSSALLAAGRPHSVLPLSGVTHMTPQEVVAENLLRLQAGFLREALGLPVDP